MKRCNLLSLVAVLFALSSPLAAHATAIGDTVQAIYTYQNVTYVKSVATVGDGVEFNPFYEKFAFDFSANQINVSLLKNTAYGSGVALGFSDLTNAFTSASLASSSRSDFLGDRVSLSGGEIILNLGGTSYNTGDTFVINTSNVAPTAVTPASVTPEPSSLMLLGTGLLGVIGAARRRFAASARCS